LYGFDPASIQFQHSGCSHFYTGNKTAQTALDKSKDASGDVIDAAASTAGVSAVSFVPNHIILSTLFCHQEYSCSLTFPFSPLFPIFQDQADKAKTAAVEQIDKVKAEIS